MNNALLKVSIRTIMHKITTHPLSLPVLNDLTINQSHIELSTEVKEKIVSCRSYLNQKMQNSEAPIYGINTGFGPCAMSRLILINWFNFKKIWYVLMRVVLENWCLSISSN